jgi:hypothetical protein
VNVKSWMASLGEQLALLAATQRAVVATLAAEYYCDDLEPPPAAFGWGEQQLREYFESGGDVLPAEVAGRPVQTPVSANASDGVQAHRPVIVCLGDSLTEFGSHVVGPTFADSTLKNLPTASEVLRATDGAVEHGPGWITLLARDYQWRMTADVINRGHSGMTSRLLKADLGHIVASLPVCHLAQARVLLQKWRAVRSHVVKKESPRSSNSPAVCAASPPPQSFSSCLTLSFNTLFRSQVALHSDVAAWRQRRLRQPGAFDAHAQPAWNAWVHAAVLAHAPCAMHPTRRVPPCHTCCSVCRFP